jgi:hypothetical protein
VLLVYVLNGSRHKYEAIPEFDDPLTPHVCVVILEATSEAIPEFDDPLTPHVLTNYTIEPLFQPNPQRERATLLSPGRGRRHSGPPAGGQ